MQAWLHAARSFTYTANACVQGIRFTQEKTFYLKGHFK